MVSKKYYKKIDGVRYYITNSTLNKYIIREDGAVFKFAIDIEDSEHTYIESEKTIKEDN